MSGQVCVLGVSSERSSICVLGVSSERSRAVKYVCVRSIE